MAKKTLSLDQAAARLRLTPDAVLAMIRSRRLVGVLVDGVWRVASADVDALLRPPTGYCPPALGSLSKGEIANFPSGQYPVPTINLDEYEIDAEVVQLVSREVCEKHRIIPVARSGSSLIVAMADPANPHAIDDIKFLTGCRVEAVTATESAITAAIERHYR